MVAKKSSELKTMKISKGLHQELVKLGGKGDTFDFIIRRLMVQSKSLRDSLEKLSKEDRSRIERRMEANYQKFL